MSTLTAPITRADGTVVLKKFNGEPRTHLDRILYWVITVLSYTAIVAGAYLVLTMETPVIVPDSPQNPTITHQQDERPLVNA